MACYVSRRFDQLTALAPMARVNYVNGETLRADYPNALSQVRMVRKSLVSAPMREARAET